MSEATWPQNINRPAPALDEGRSSSDIGTTNVGATVTNHQHGDGDSGIKATIAVVAVPMLQDYWPRAILWLQNPQPSTSNSNSKPQSLNKQV